MTDPDLAARAAALARRSATRRVPSAPPSIGRGRPFRRRKHAAGTSRIVAAGLSAAALFGLVGALTLAAPTPPATATAAAPTVAAAPPPRRHVIVIIHRRHDATTATAPTATAPASSATPAPSAPTTPSRRSVSDTTTKSS